MKRCSIALLFLLLVGIEISAQITYVNSTFRKQSWSDLPVVLADETAGGLHTAELDLDGLTPIDIATSLNALILAKFREAGMIVVNTDPNENVRYFQFVTAETWREVYILASWQSGVTYFPGQPIMHNGNLFISRDTIVSVEPLAGLDWKDSWANLGGLDTTDLDFALKNLSNLEDVAINADLTPVKTDTLDLGAASKRWSNAYLSDSVFLGQDTAMDIVKLEDWMDVKDTLNSTALSSVGYLHKALKEGGDEINFLLGEKEITRTGLPGVTGVAMNVDNLEEFLKKVFFPVTNPMINSFNHNNNTTAGQFSFQTEDAQGLLTDNEGTLSVPFSIWKTGNLDFFYDVENRSVRPTDTSEDTPIDSVVLYNGATRLGMNVDGSLNSSVTGSFSTDRSMFSADTNGVGTNELALIVHDAYPNVVPLKFNVNFQPALGVLIPTANVTDNGLTAIYQEAAPAGAGSAAAPFLIERTGVAIDLDLYWTYNVRDDAGAISDIEFVIDGLTGSIPPISGTNLTDQRADITIPNSYLNSFRYRLRARGAIANDWSAYRATSYYKLMDKSYAGFLSSDLEPTAVQLQGLQNGKLDNASFYEATNGITETNAVGGSGFFTWAIPTYESGVNAAPVGFTAPTPFYEAAGTWYVNSNINTYFVKIIPSGGGDGSWYWVGVYKASTSNGGNIKVKLQ